MARFYHVEIARHAAGADPKWVDNLLSHFSVPGVESARQGVARRITLSGVYHIALIRRLNRELGLPVSSAVALASRLLAGDAARASVAPGLEFHVDRSALERDVDRLVSESVESSSRPRRGRPPRRRSE
jgi:hypothetical protein